MSTLPPELDDLLLTVTEGLDYKFDSNKHC